MPQDQQNDSRFCFCSQILMLSPAPDHRSLRILGRSCRGTVLRAKRLATCPIGKSGPAYGPSWKTDVASDAQHRAIGGNGRSAVIAERTCRIKPHEAITPAIWRAMEPIQAIRV
jgi:hypothetical protein